jgi:nitroimidazol reductase NimA-like FMN-containing flavoprotein (pyridoxamine 5'-phosphate oxidase superfamily)
MSDNETEKKPNFDPIKLEQVNVNKDYPMEPDEFDILFKHNCYCHMAHISKYGYPIVTPMFYVVLDGFVHISSVQKYRQKIDHLIANPKISVSISNDGSNAKRQKSIQIIGNAEISFDQELLTKVHWAIIDKYWWDLKDNEEMRQAAFKGVNTPNRGIIKVIPNKNSPTSWDFGKMVDMYERGVWFNEVYKMCHPFDVR